MRLTLSTIKHPRFSQEFEAYFTASARCATVERWRSEASAYPRLVKVSPRKTVETIAVGSIYRLNLSKSKVGRNTFLDCVHECWHFNSRNRKQQALGKHHYDDSEIKAFFDFRGAIGRKGRNALALRARALNETDSATVFIQRYDYSPSYRAKSNRLSKR